MKDYFIKNCGVIVAAFIVLIASFTVIISGQNLFIPVHDNLDGGVALYKILTDYGLWFAQNCSVPLVGGIDRNYFGSEFKMYSVLYMLFPAFWAFISGCLMKLVISCFGFVYLLKSLNLYNENNKNYLIFIALLYGMIPVFPFESFSFATLPFLLGALTNYYKKPDYKYLLFFLIYPVFSSFVFFGFFILGYLSIYILFDWIKNRKIRLEMLLPVICLSITYIITEYRMFYLMFLGQEETIRVLFDIKYIGFREVIKTALQYFFIGQYHCSAMHSVIILPSVLAYFFYINIKYTCSKNFGAVHKDLFNIVFALIILNVVIASVDNFGLFRKILLAVLPMLDGFSFARTIWLNPVLWYVAFAIAVSRFHIENLKVERTIKVTVCLLAFLSYFLFNVQSGYNLIKYNIDSMKYKIQKREDRNLTYKEFYSESLFNKIKQDISYNGEWSAAYGMHPSVLLYNNIKILDGYASFAPAKKAKLFTKLIKPDLDVDKDNADYYYTWPARSYLYSGEIGYQPEYNLEKNEANLLINPDIFKQMEGKYIFSRVKILNNEALGLTFVNKYTDEISPYNIYLYKTE